MLVDKVKITVIGGKGGDGAVSFRREKFVPKGGPDGGNGGIGGDVYVRGVNNIRLLKKFRETPVITGNPGINGADAKRSGARGEDMTIVVPIGTRITNLKNNRYFDILNDEEKILLVKGGRGGHGNWMFRSATNQTPLNAEPGRPGEEKELELELMMIADIGLIGLPNVGKSSLLNTLTNAHAEVADYNFTTLEPNLGTFGKLIIADIPGLIEGAHMGKGLGVHFLRHVERTRLLVHCISAQSPDPEKDYKIIRDEMESFDKALMNIPEIIVVTKADLISDDKAKKEITKKLKKITANPLFLSIVDDVSMNILKASLPTLSQSK